MSAAAPLDLGVVTPDDLAEVRRDLVDAQTALEDLLVVAGDGTSPAPVWTPRGQADDMDRTGVLLRTLLQLATAKVDAISALVRLAGERRRLRSVDP